MVGVGDLLDISSRSRDFKTSVAHLQWLAFVKSMGSVSKPMGGDNPPDDAPPPAALRIGISDVDLRFGVADADFDAPRPTALTDAGFSDALTDAFSDALPDALTTDAFSLADLPFLPFLFFFLRPPPFMAFIGGATVGVDIIRIRPGVHATCLGGSSTNLGPAAAGLGPFSKLSARGERPCFRAKGVCGVIGSAGSRLGGGDCGGACFRVGGGTGGDFAEASKDTLWRDMFR